MFRFTERGHITIYPDRRILLISNGISESARNLLFTSSIRTYLHSPFLKRIYFNFFFILRTNNIKKAKLFLINADTMLMLSFTIFITICSEN